VPCSRLGLASFRGFSAGGAGVPHARARARGAGPPFRRGHVRTSALAGAQRRRARRGAQHSLARVGGRGHRTCGTKLDVHLNPLACWGCGAAGTSWLPRTSSAAQSTGPVCSGAPSGSASLGRLSTRSEDRAGRGFSRSVEKRWRRESESPTLDVAPLGVSTDDRSYGRFGVT
jgi:hypothetical protein